MSDRVWPIDRSILDDPKRRVVRLDIHYAVGQRERDTVESARIFECDPRTKVVLNRL